MNKIISILSILFFIFCSCTEEERARYLERIDRVQKAENVAEQIEQEIEKSNTNLSDVNVYVFQYKGHDMIIISTSHSNSSVGGIIHDFNCKKCSKESNIQRDTVLSDYERAFGLF